MLSVTQQILHCLHDNLPTEVLGQEEAALPTTKKAPILQGEFRKEGRIFSSVLEWTKIHFLA